MQEDSYQKFVTVYNLLSPTAARPHYPPRSGSGPIWPQHREAVTTMALQLAECGSCVYSQAKSHGHCCSPEFKESIFEALKFFIWISQQSEARLKGILFYNYEVFKYIS